MNRQFVICAAVHVALYLGVVAFKRVDDRVVDQLVVEVRDVELCQAAPRLG